MMGFLLAVGIVVDGTLYYIGYISYNIAALPIPFWLAVIWLALATLPHHSLKWLKNRYLLSRLLWSYWRAACLLGGGQGRGCQLRLAAASIPSSARCHLGAAVADGHVCCRQGCGKVSCQGRLPHSANRRYP